MKAKWIEIAVAMSIFTTLAGVPSAAQARARSCTAENTAGDYGYTNSGSIPALGAFTFVSVGRVTIDASGQVTGSQSTSLNGVIVHETISGTVTVNPDCTGTGFLEVRQGGTVVRTAQVDSVVVDDQNEIHAIFLTGGTAITSIAKRISRADE